MPQADRKGCACGTFYHRACWEAAKGCLNRECRNWMMLASPSEFDAAVGPAPDAPGAARGPKRLTTGWGAAGALTLGVVGGGLALPLLVKLVRGAPPPGISFGAVAAFGAAVLGVITFVGLVILDMTYDLVAAWGSDDPEQRSVRTRCLGLLALAALGGAGGAGAAYVWAIPSGEPASWTSLVVGAVLGTVGTFYVLARLKLEIVDRLTTVADAFRG